MPASTRFPPPRNEQRAISLLLNACHKSPLPLLPRPLRTHPRATSSLPHSPLFMLSRNCGPNLQNGHSCILPSYFLFGFSVYFRKKGKAFQIKWEWLQVLAPLHLLKFFLLSTFYSLSFFHWIRLRSSCFYFFLMNQRIFGWIFIFVSFLSDRRQRREAAALARKK